MLVIFGSSRIRASIQKPSAISLLPPFVGWPPAEPRRQGGQVPGLVGKAIIQIACGSYHTILLDAEGRVYPFGRYQAFRSAHVGAWHRLPGRLVVTDAPVTEES